MDNISCSLNDLSQEFGSNIPKIFQYEGGTGSVYLFCVDAKIDVENICKKYYIRKSIASHIYIDNTLEIDELEYNNNYEIYHTASIPKYKLKKIRQQLFKNI
jgi:hypothetical protein